MAQEKTTPITESIAVEGSEGSRNRRPCVSRSRQTGIDPRAVEALLMAEAAGLEGKIRLLFGMFSNNRTLLVTWIVAITRMPPSFIIPSLSRI